MILPVAIDFANVNLLWVEVMEPVCSLGFQAFILRFVCARLQFSTANSWNWKNQTSETIIKQGFLQNCAAEVTIVTEVHEVAQVAEVAEVAKVALVLIFHVILFLQNGPLQLTSISLHGIHVLDIHTSTSMLSHSEIHLYHICSLHNFYHKLLNSSGDSLVYRLMYAVPWVFSVPHIPLQPFNHSGNTSHLWM